MQKRSAIVEKKQNGRVGDANRPAAPQAFYGMGDGFPDQAVQASMSILARDGVGEAELRAVADVAMQRWDARIAGERS